MSVNEACLCQWMYWGSPAPMYLTTWKPYRFGCNDWAAVPVLLLPRLFTQQTVLKASMVTGHYELIRRSVIEPPKRQSSFFIYQLQKCSLTVEFSSNTKLTKLFIKKVIYIIIISLFSRSNHICQVTYNGKMLISWQSLSLGAELITITYCLTVDLFLAEFSKKYVN